VTSKDSANFVEQVYGERISKNRKQYIVEGFDMQDAWHL
jgi:hypothetical protein